MNMTDYQAGFVGGDDYLGNTNGFQYQQPTPNFAPQHDFGSASERQKPNAQELLESLIRLSEQDPALAEALAKAIVAQTEQAAVQPAAAPVASEVDDWNRQEVSSAAPSTDSMSSCSSSPPQSVAQDSGLVEVPVNTQQRFAHDSTLYIEGIPEHVGDEEVMQLCNSLDGFERLSVTRRPSKRYPGQFCVLAFIEMNSRHQAQSAISRLQRVSFDDSGCGRLRVHFARPKPIRNVARYYGL